MAAIDEEARVSAYFLRHNAARPVCTRHGVWRPALAQRQRAWRRTPHLGSPPLTHQHRLLRLKGRQVEACFGFVTVTVMRYVSHNATHAGRVTNTAQLYMVPDKLKTRLKRAR